jgi:hypothetical protein
LARRGVLTREAMIMTALDNNPDGGPLEFGSGLRRFLARRDEAAGPHEPLEPEADLLADDAASSAARKRQYHLAPPPLENEARTFLAYRVEEEAELLWAVFAEALVATTASGRPDHRTRLLAARTLLAETQGSAPARAGKGVRVKDELAELRRRRTV